MAGDINAPHNLIALLPGHSYDGENEAIKIDVLDKSYANRYEDAGVRFYTEGEIRGGSVVSCVKDALEVLARVPTLAATVFSLVRSLHLIKPEDDDYDVSFSEPDVPFSIFVSVPQGNSPIHTMRVAEAIVHESMHLQLTLIEGFVPLVTETQRKIFSPWKEEFRTIQGVLHALYVFRVIDTFLKCLSSIQNHPVVELKYIQGRCEEIDEQIKEIRSFPDRVELTTIGACFVKDLIQS
ncbi:MAG: HEXXH motif-containing putative peptide modification protein [Acidobacteriota bacterium]|nr:HEXXH motif-containing putative peptide modification protein [Acidobacteriota bacterium]